MIRGIFADVFLGLAVAIVLLSSVGVLVMRGVYDKLHFVTPAALVAPILVMLAVLVHAGFSATSAETLAGAALHGDRRPLPYPCHHPGRPDPGEGGLAHRRAGQRPLP